MQSAHRYERIYETVRRIPPGRVATYGQVASEAGWPGRARQVGRALRELPGGSGVPWHRVVNARGEVSERCPPGDSTLQHVLLEAEGLAFDARGRLDLDRWGWRP